MRGRSEKIEHVRWAKNVCEERGGEGGERNCFGYGLCPVLAINHAICFSNVQPNNKIVKIQNELTNNNKRYFTFCYAFHFFFILFFFVLEGVRCSGGLRHSHLFLVLGCSCAKYMTIWCLIKYNTTCVLFFFSWEPSYIYKYKNTSSQFISSLNSKSSGVTHATTPLRWNFSLGLFRFTFFFLFLLKSFSFDSFFSSLSLSFLIV